MKRFEFFGVPGVGKSTVYRGLLRQRNRHERWITPQEARVLAVKKYLCNRCSSDQALVRMLLLKTVRIKAVQNKISENLSNNLAVDALNTKIEEWSGFIELCSESFCDKGKPAFYRMLLNRWLLSSMEDAALVELTNSGHRVLFDESLLQRATGLMPWECSLVERKSKKYFNLVPMPDAAIALVAEPSLVLERLMERPALAVQHEGLSKENLLERTEIAAVIVKTGLEIMRIRGAKILELDACRPVEQTIEDVKRFINNA